MSTLMLFESWRDRKLSEKGPDGMWVLNVNTIPDFTKAIAAGHKHGIKTHGGSESIGMEQRAYKKGELSHVQSSIAGSVVSKFLGLPWNEKFGRGIKGKQPMIGHDIQLYTSVENSWSDLLVRDHQPGWWRFLLVKGFLDLANYERCQLVVEGWKVGYDAKSLAISHKKNNLPKIASGG